MAERFQGNVSCVIPLTYKCSHCGAQSSSTIPLTEMYTGSITLWDGSRESQIRAARFEATRKLETTVKKVYTDGPLMCGHNLVGKCTACGQKEVWQTSAKKNSAESIWGAVIGLLLVLICIVVPILLRAPILIPVFLIAGLFLLIKFAKVIDNLSSEKGAVRQKKMRAIPEENKPVFVLTCQEMLEKLQ